MSFLFRTDRRFRQAIPLGGPTANRPTTPPTGTMYFDTTLTKPVWWDGANWKTASNVVA